MSFCENFNLGSVCVNFFAESGENSSVRSQAERAIKRRNRCIIRQVDVGPCTKPRKKSKSTLLIIINFLDNKLHY